MTVFRTRRSDGQVFPISEGKEHRVVDDYKQPEPEEENEEVSYEEAEEEYQASLEEEQAQKEEEEKKRTQELRKRESPSYFTKSNVKSDVKHLMRADDSKISKEKNYQKYKSRLDRTMDITHAKEDAKADRRRERQINKAEKYGDKAEKLKQEIGET